jgi:hypothetical protein
MPFIFGTQRLPNEETYFAKAKPLSKMDFNIFY